MGIIDIESMYWEMKNTMKCNVKGTPTERYKKAKKLFLKYVDKIIEQNKKDLIKEVRKSI